MIGNGGVFTYLLENGATLEIKAEYGLKKVSILCSSGTGSVVGSEKIGNIPSTPLPMKEGDEKTWTNATYSISGLNITADLGGVLEVIGSQN